MTKHYYQTRHYKIQAFCWSDDCVHPDIPFLFNKETSKVERMIYGKTPIRPGDWLVFNDDGKLTTLTDAQFQAKYEKLVVQELENSPILKGDELILD